ncbi:bacteriocin-associated integral membrane family protein [Streptomyces sp. NPDC127051]|uniref:bacteriocin-associated integral membrane family protein n=1 Tax=Streptomyces sp. NPDC127051 TaxID=3347119 RepID=UPI00365D7524
MLHRGIKFVYAAVFAFSALVAFLFVRGLDEDYVLGHSAVVWVLDSDDSASGSDVARGVAAFAAEHKVTVAREVPDLRNPDGLRHLYLATGAPNSVAASWLKEGYPAFGRDLHTEVHPLAEIGQRDPRGYYYVFGPPAASDALVATFKNLGLRASIHHPLSFEELTPFYADSILVLSFAVVALAAITMTGASVLLNAKAYGVLRLQGRSFTDILFRDLRQLAGFATIAATAVVAGALVVLALYNGLAWLGLFASVATGIAGLLVLLILAAHAAMLALTFRTDVLRALKGELPARAASTSAYLVRVPALLLAFSIATSTVLAAQDVLSRQDSRELYAKVGDTAAIRLNGSLGEEDTKTLEAKVGQWLRQSDAAGELIVAGRRDLQDLAPGAGLPQGEILIVNETFLDRQPFLDPAGRRYAPAPKDGKSPDSRPVRLIVPASLSRHAPTIAAEIPGTLSPGHRERIKADQIETLQAANGQQVFGYNAGEQVHTAARNTKEDRSLVHDPVLLVVPNGSTYLTDNAYTSFATQGGVVFPDPVDIQKGIDAKKLQTYVIAIRPVGQNAALQMRDSVNDLRMQLFNLGIAVTVLIITGIGVCIVYSRKNAQAIFVKHISGWRFVASHRSVLSIEGILALLLVAWVPFQVWQQNRELEQYTAAGIPAPSQPAQITALDLGLTGGLVALEAGAVLLALAVFHRRIVKEGATEG